MSAPMRDGSAKHHASQTPQPAQTSRTTQTRQAAQTRRTARTRRDELTMSALRAVRDFGDAHDRMSGGIRHRMHMNATDLAALRLLIMREESGRTVSPADIARHLRISTASTAKLLDRLTESGHVRRTAHPTDRRARVIELTDGARAEFFRLFGVRLDAIRGALAPFSEEELAVAARVMGAVSGAIDQEDL